MKSREQAVRFIKRQFGKEKYNGGYTTDGKGKTNREKAGREHYGLQELRDLLDHIYEGEPTNNAEILYGNCRHKWMIYDKSTKTNKPCAWFCDKCHDITLTNPVIKLKDNQ